MTIRPRRSVIYMPASNARAVEKARTLPVDGLVLDLEDAVAPEAKAQARAKAVAAVKAGGFGRREVFVRINGLDTEFGLDDAAAAATAGADAIMVPKVGDPAVLTALGEKLRAVNAPAHVTVWAMIETMSGVLRAAEIAALARNAETRLAGFIIGPNDLVKESQGRLVPGRGPLLPWLMHVLAAGRAHGIVVLDGVYNDIADKEGFRAECEQGRDMGFDGKTLIHPSQIEPCNDVFSPDAEEVAQARKIIGAFEQPENRDKGVIQLDGRMVERMHADIARRIVAIADAIGA